MAIPSAVVGNTISHPSDAISRRACRQTISQGLAYSWFNFDGGYVTAARRSSGRFAFVHELVGVAMDEPPSVALKPERLSDAQFHDRCRLAIWGVACPAFQAHQTGNVRAHGNADVLLTVIAAVKVRGRPGEPRAHFGPAMFEAAKAPHHSHVVTMRIELLQPGCIAVHEISLRSRELGHRCFPGAVRHVLEPPVMPLQVQKRIRSRLVLARRHLAR